MLARVRQIHPELWSDAKVVQLSGCAQLLFLGALNFADDEGRIEWNARQFQARFLSRFSLEEIAAWMGEVSTVGLATVYRAHGREYAYFRNFRRYQYTNKPRPSMLPAPDEAPRASYQSADSCRRARPIISDAVKRRVAVAYGCEPGETKRLMCVRCEVDFEIRWQRRQSGHAGSNVGLWGASFTVTEQADVGSENDVQIACKTCAAIVPRPASLSPGPLFEAPEVAAAAPLEAAPISRISRISRPGKTRETAISRPISRREIRETRPVEASRDPIPSTIRAQSAPEISFPCPPVSKGLDLVSVSLLNSKSISAGGVGESKIDSPVVATATPPAPAEKKTRRIKPELPAPTAFSAELEAEVVAFVALCAQRNRDGSISVGRIAGIRREVALRAANLGEPAIVHGLREAIRYDKPSINYAAACAKAWRPEAERARPARAPVVERTVGTIPREDRDGAWYPRWLEEQRRLRAESELAKKAVGAA